MELKLNRQMTIIAILSIMILVLVGSIFYYENKLSKQDAQAQLATANLNKQIDELTTELDKANEELRQMEQVKEKVEFIEKYIDLEGEEIDMLKKAKDISDNTPLDFESSVVLISYSERYDLKPSLLLSMIEFESNFNQWEVGTHQDRGYMQIIPSTEKWLAKDFGHEIGIKYDPSKIFEPEYNIGLAATYLNMLRDSYGNDMNRILSEYNRGPYGLAKYYARNNTYETSYSRTVLSKEKKYLSFNY